MQLVAALQAAATQPVAEVAPPPRMRSWAPLTVGGIMLLGGGLLLGRGIGPATPVPTTLPTVISPPPRVTASVIAKDSTIQAVAPALSEAASGTFTYVVRPGDTLRGIAWRLYGKASLAERLGKDNGITEPRRLPVGRRLRVFSI